MSLEIRWSSTAEITFDAIYDFVIKQCEFQIAEKLKSQVLRTLNQISIHPYTVNNYFYP